MALNIIKISTAKEAATMSPASYKPKICLAGGLLSRFAQLIASLTFFCHNLFIFGFVAIFEKNNVENLRFFCNIFAKFVTDIHTYRQSDLY